MKFGEPSAEPEEHNEALPATSNTAQSPADLEQTMLGESFAVTIIYIYIMKFWLQTQMLIRVSVFPHHCQPEDNLRHGKTLHASSFPRNLSRDASPRRPGQCIWVLDDPIVRGKRFRLQCRAPKENLRVPNLLSCLVYPGIR